MNDLEPKDPIKENVLARIREGSIRMRSRKYFYVEVAATLVVAALVLVLSAFIFNFILFSIFAEHRAPLLGYGPSGYLLFLQLFPWLLLIADIFFLILLRVLLRRFEIAYRNPSLYVLLILILVIGAFGFVLHDRTDVNERLEREAHTGHLPQSVGDFFDEAHEAPPMLDGHQ